MIAGIPCGIWYKKPELYRVYLEISEEGSESSHFKKWQFGVFVLTPSLTKASAS